VTRRLPPEIENGRAPSPARVQLASFSFTKMKSADLTSASKAVA